MCLSILNLKGVIKLEIVFLTLMYLLFLLPPIATILLTGDREKVIVSFMCTSFFFIPGLIHLLLIIKEKSKNELICEKSSDM